MGLFDVFRTNSRPPDPAATEEEDEEENLPEPVAGGLLWRRIGHRCEIPDGIVCGLTANDANSIWRCFCGKRYRWSGTFFCEASARTKDDADFHSTKDDDDDDD